MRSVTFISVLALCFACIGTKKSDNLNGTWVPVKQEIGGTEIPATSFQKQVLIISDSTYTFTAESVDKGVLKYDAARMDIYGKNGLNSGKHISAIYKLIKEELTICYNLQGDSYPTNFETKNKPTFFLSVFKRK